MSTPLTIAAAAAAIAAGTLSPIDLVEQCLDRIARWDGTIHAFVRLMAEEARGAARDAAAELASGRRRGPLHGIPVAIKDIFDVAGSPTTGHSRLLIDNVAGADAHVVAKLRAAGAIVLGKLATHEFALGGPSFDLPWPPARNPWDTERFTGGSSSGTGAAVAAGFVLGGTGSDTGGSIRMPAAFCGVVGLKPTYGLLSRHGILPLSASLDHAGPLAWTVDDCAILLQAMAGHDPRDPASIDMPLPDYRSAVERGVAGLRIGVVRNFFEVDSPLSSPMAAGLEEALAQFARLGASLHDLRLSPLDDYAAVGHTIMLVEGFAVHAQHLRERPGIYGRAFADRMSLGSLFTATDYIQALRQRRVLSDEIAARFADVDVLLTGMAPTTAPLLADVGPFASYQRPAFSLPANLAGLPALSLCTGYGPDGLPLSVQLIGRAFDEPTLLAVAGAYEAATPWRERRPALLVGQPAVRET